MVDERVGLLAIHLYRLAELKRCVWLVLMVGCITPVTWIWLERVPDNIIWEVGFWYLGGAFLLAAYTLLRPVAMQEVLLILPEEAVPYSLLGYRAWLRENYSSQYDTSIEGYHRHLGTM